jgi:gamma-glutamyltranspeptidase / glutathione hydrolase
MRIVLIVMLVALGGCMGSPSRPASSVAPPVRFGSVATVNPIATDAAMHILQDGGNAIDAAVGAMLMLGVVDGYNSGIGGGCFILIRTKDGRVIAINGRETAPALATHDMFIRNGKADAMLSQVGPLAVATPGAIRAYQRALQSHGTQSLSRLLVAPQKIAQNGFGLNADYAARITSQEKAIRASPELAKLLTHPDGKLLQTGDTLVQVDLARTYQHLIDHGPDWFYTGEFADRVDAWMQAHDGILRKGDFANYVASDLRVIRSTYRGHEVIGVGPPSSGGTHVAQILSMLERFDVRHLSDADRATVLTNAMSLAFADRAEFLGDQPVPKGLLNWAYLQARSRLIATDKPVESVTPGDPMSFDDTRHTTHVSVIDAQGNAVAITATINTTFGSKVIVPRTGVFLNNQMDDFSAQPGAANHFGLVGAEANAVGPGKRPLSSMSPTIVISPDGELVVIGAAGGPRIITQVVNVLVNLIDRDMSPRDAVAAWRVHHQWKPDRLWIEKTAPQEVRDALRGRGFELDEANPVGATNLVTSSHAVSEPRLNGKADRE